MLKTAFVRKSHRALGFFLGIQLLLWTVSGAYFALTDIDEIRGDHNKATVDPPAWDDDWISPTAIGFESAGITRPSTIEDLSLVHIANRTFYRIVSGDHDTVILADVETGAIRPPLNEEEAVALARESFAHEAEIKSVTRLEEGDTNSHHEYRGGPLPAYVVSFDHGSGTRVYVSTRDGRVVSHRNTLWRIFDFLWMLHTMDYAGRDDFNNPLLRMLALSAIVAIISGYLLWGRTSRRWRGRS